MSFTWKSKEYRFSDQNFSCALVDGDDLENIGIRIYCDKQEIKHVQLGELTKYAFRLGNERGNVWEFELYGEGEVKTVTISNSMNEIKAIAYGA